MQATCTDSTGAAFVFLDLLKCEPEGIAKIPQAETEKLSLGPEACANVNVYWVWHYYFP